FMLSYAALHSTAHPVPTRRSSDLQDRHHARVDPVEDLGPFVPGTRTQHLGETFPKFGPAFLVPLVGKFHTVEPDTLQEGRVELRSEEHTSELQSRFDLVCRLLLEK